MCKLQLVSVFLFTMINTAEFSKRLQKIITYYGLSSSALADKIGVQRSSISHIISGRNKPSLDFVLKVLSAFPEVDLYWLLNGQGSFPKNNTPTAQSNVDKKPIKKVIINDKKEIERIIILYKDGSFKHYDS